jgi:hypothetical protein
MLLTLLLPLTPAALATEQGPGRTHQVRVNQTSVATDTTFAPRPEMPFEVLEQVASLFSDERGLAISNTASIFLLCNQSNLLEDSDYQTDTLANLGVGLKIKF